MEQKQITATYAEAVKAIKEAILESRYRAARLVNKEVLALYYAIGGYISVQSRAARWGKCYWYHLRIAATGAAWAKRFF